MNVEHNSLYQSHHNDWKQAPLSRKEDDTESYKSTEDNITEKNSLEQSRFCSKEVSKLVEPMTTLSSVEGSGSYMSMLLDDLSDIDEDEDEDINYRRKKFCAKEDQDVKNLFESETSNHLSNLVEQNEKERQVRSFMSPKFNDNRSSTTDISNLSGLANFEPISVPVTSLKDTLINYSLIMPSCLQEGANQTNASCGSPQREKENEKSEKLREVQTIEELKRKIKDGNKVMSKSNTVHLSNLPNKFTRVEALNAIFKRFGTIVNIHVDDYAKRAYVEYKTEQEAIKAVKMANQLKLNFFGNNKIIISEVANTFINETITTIDTVLAELTNIIRTILSLRKHQADKHKLDSKITMVKELMKKLKKDNSIEKHRAELKRFGIILC